MSKSILVTLVALVALGLVYYFSGNKHRSTVPTGESAGLESFKNLPFDQVAKITLAKGNADPVEIVKKSPGWVVASRWSYEADGETIDKLVASLKKITGGEIQGKSAASHEDFEVDKRKGGFIRLHDKDGKQLGEVVVGKSAPNPDFKVRQSFLRFNGEDTTYRVNTDLQSDAKLYSDLEAKRYLKTKLFSLESDMEISQVRLIRPGKDDLIVERRYRIKEPEVKEENKEEEKDEDAGDGAGSTDAAAGSEGEKKDAPKEEVKPEKVEYFVVTSGTETHEVGDGEKWRARSLVDKARNLSIEDAADPASKDLGLDAPQLQAIVTYAKKDDEKAEPKNLRLIFGNAYKDDSGEDKGYYFRAELPGHEQLAYKIVKYDFESWNKELKEFLPAPPKTEEKPADATSSAGTPSPEGTPSSTGDASGSTAPGDAAGQGTPPEEAKSSATPATPGAEGGGAAPADPGAGAPEEPEGDSAPSKP